MINLEQYAGPTEFPVVETGTYEVVLTATIRTAKNGTSDYLNVCYKIRDDVEQGFKNSCVFEKIFRDKTNAEWFDLKKLGSILITQKDMPGYTTEFDEVEEFIQFINGASLVVTIEKIFDDYSQKEVNQIKYASYRPTKVGPYKASATAAGVAEAKNVQQINIDDSDLPF